MVHLDLAAIRSTIGVERQLKQAIATLQEAHLPTAFVRMMIMAWVMSSDLLEHQ